MVHRFLRYIAVGVLAAGAVGLGACAGDEADPATTPETQSPDIAVTGTDQLTFEPDAFEAPGGEETTLELTAEAGVEHDVVVADAADVGTAGEGDHDADADADIDAGDLHVAHAEAGQTTSAAFTIGAPGTYEVYCSVPGHREAGMTATLTVTDAG